MVCQGLSLDGLSAFAGYEVLVPQFASVANKKHILGQVPFLDCGLSKNT